MEYIYAAMLLHKAGHKVDEASVKKVLSAAGVNADDSRVKALVAALNGVDIEKAIKEASVMNVAAPAAAAVDTGAADAAKKAAEAKKKADEESKKKEQASAGLGALFG